MSTDNRTEINDCDSSSGWQGDGSPNLTQLTGQFYEGTGAVQGQHSNSDQESFTNDDSTGAAFSLDLTDSTVYFLLKDNLVDTYVNGGIQLIIQETTSDRIGYDIGGNDAPGVEMPLGFRCLKGDCNSINTTPGGHTVYVGTETNIAFTAIDGVGFGSLHLAKAQGNVANWVVDRITYIANGSYALTINGGTSGTPETMTDVQGDDETNGWGMVSNPLGSLFYFAAPTEWGEDAANADHYFEATGEQWFWVGDNGGGRAIGATHFPFRVIGNSTDTGSFVISGVTIVNTGTGAEFDCSSTNVDTLEIDGCSMSGLANFSAPQSGGTSRFCTNTVFTDCGQVIAGTSVADMSGCSFLTPTVAVDEGAFYDTRTTTAAESIDELDNTTFSKGTNAHHAIRFGTGVTHDITLTGIEFTGFGSTDDANDSTVRFDATTGSLTLNLVNCTVDGAAASESNFSVDDAAGISVTLNIDPVTTKVNVKDETGANMSGASVWLRAKDATGDLPYNQSITSITRSGTTATVTFAAAHGLKTNQYLSLSGITDKTEDNNGAHQVTVTGTTTLTYTTTNSGSTAYTGTITGTGAVLYGTTNASGDISSASTWSGNQPVRGSVRKATTSPLYKQALLDDTISSTDGLTINVRMIRDD